MAKNSEGPGPRRFGGMSVSSRTVGIVVVAILVVWFILMNTASVKMHLWGLSTVSSPLWLVLAVVLAAGTVFGWLVRRNRDRR